MSNYYTGKLEFYIDQDKISYKDLQDFLEKLENAIEFKYEDHETVHIPFYTIVVPNYEALKAKYNFSDYVLDVHKYSNFGAANGQKVDLSLYNEFIKEEVARIERVLCTDVLHDFKGFTKFFIVATNVDINHMEKDIVEKCIVEIIDALSPYRYPRSDNDIIGEIRDENNFYYKEFLWDGDKVRDKDISDRLKICDNCKHFTRNWPCNFIEVCKDAYNRGYNDGHVDGLNLVTNQ